MTGAMDRRASVDSANINSTRLAADLCAGAFAIKQVERH